MSCGADYWRFSASGSCGDCARAPETIDDPQHYLGLPVVRALRPAGCPACGGTGYRGRILLAEMLALKSAAAVDLGKAMLAKADSSVLEPLAVQAGMVTRWRRAIQAVESGATSPAEVRRVLGLAAVT